ncbi:MAG: shikimate kinase [Candidatus Omnitrophica bacterium]|nr:shikimate kinase [Candidatus Omnitrophota bacterium]
MMQDQKNIVLVGFMASGKTFASRELAKCLSRECVSTDELVEKREGMRIADIFAKKGEPYFRQVEKEIVREASAQKNLVIDCGGGVAANEENFNVLKATGISFYLYASPESVYRRTKGKTDRPLLNVPDPLGKIKELLAKRDPHYRTAHFIVDSNEDNIGKVVDEILFILSKDKS